MPLAKYKNGRYFTLLAIVLIAGTALWWFDREDSTTTVLDPEGASSASSGHAPGLDPRTVGSRSEFTAPDAPLAAYRPARTDATLRCLLRSSFEALGPDRIECVGNGAVHWDSSAREFRLTAGWWRLRSLEPELVVPHASFRLQAGERDLVWASERTELSILVTDEFHRPLEGATVRWTALGRRTTISYTPPEWNSAGEGRTNAQGLCPLTVEAHRAGGLQVLLDGYLPLSDTRVALPSNEPWTVRMEPERSTDSVSTILVLDAPTGALIPFPWVRSMESPARWRGDESGRVRLPYGTIDAKTLTIGAEGHVPRTWFFRTVEAEYEVSLVRTAKLSVVVEGPADAGEITLLVFPVPEGSTDDGRSPIWFVESHEVLNGEAIVIEAPSHAPVDLLAYDEFGRSAHGRAEGGTQNDVVRLRIEPRPIEDLLIRLWSPADAVPEALAIATVESPITHLALRIRSREGALRIPFAERITSISIRAEDHAPVYLRPTRRVAPARKDSVGSSAGSLGTTLLAATELEVRVVDEDERPLGGYYIELDDDRGSEAFHAQPELHGAWPTDHPAWMETRPNSSIHQRQTTGADGRVLLRDVPTLPVEISASPHPEVSSRNAFLIDGAREVDLSSGDVQTVTLRLPRSRFVELIVVDALTDLPLPSFELRGGLPGEDPSRNGVEGSYWADLVPDGARITVKSPGYLERQLTFESGSNARRRVRLTPAAEGGLVFYGTDLSRALLTYRIESDDERRNLGRPRRAGFEKGEGGFLPAASFPGGGRLFLTSVAIDGVTYAVSPEQIPLPIPRDGPSVRVHVTRE